MCFCASEVSARGNAGVSAAMESGTNRELVRSLASRMSLEGPRGTRRRELAP